MGTFTSRIPSPTPEQKEQSREININSDENPPVAREVLIRNHIRRWGAIKKKWIDTAKRNEQRYNMSKQILDGIYAKSVFLTRFLQSFLNLFSSLGLRIV